MLDPPHAVVPWHRRQELVPNLQRQFFGHVGDAGPAGDRDLGEQDDGACRGESVVNAQATATGAAMSALDAVGQVVRLGHAVGLPGSRCGERPNVKSR